MKSHRSSRRGAPAKAATLRQKAIQRGRGVMPKELSAVANYRIIYSTSPGSKPPRVMVESLGAAQPHEWSIKVPVCAGSGGERHGISMERHPIMTHRSSGGRGAAAYHPKWLSRTYYPQPSERPPAPKLRRFNGQSVDPLIVYDSKRVGFIPIGYPFASIGRIDNNRGGYGTATLIGDRLLLTAGHLVPWGDSPWWIRFTPAYYQGKSQLGAGVESYVSDARGHSVSDVAGYDWAILRLYEPLGSSLGYLGYNNYDTDWNGQYRWWNVGYPGDVGSGEEPSLQIFAIDDADDDDDGGEELESDSCDINHGNSGGPMYGWFNNATDPRVVGVVSGDETKTLLGLITLESNNIFAAGDGMLEQCNWGRLNWPK